MTALLLLALAWWLLLSAWALVTLRREGGPLAMLLGFRGPLPGELDGEGR